MDESGTPLSIIVTGANRHEVTQLTRLMVTVILTTAGKGMVCLYADKGHD